MKVLALDTETTTWNNGNPFDKRNWLVCSSWASSDGKSGCVRGIQGISELVDSHDIIVGFNFKFDHHWFHKCGLDLSGKSIIDCQVAEFIITNQTARFPSLNECAEKYLGQQKLDIIKLNYWDQGINTHEIPEEILFEYAELDAILTLGVYQKQFAMMSPAQRRLLKLQCMDTQILAEMEWNGLTYNPELCASRSKDINDKISEITEQLTAIYPDVPLNFNSGDHLSAFLYGGVVKEEVKEHIGFFKTGQRAGEPKYKNALREHLLPRVVEPLKGSELKKEGFYATNEDTLKKLRTTKRSKRHIELILELSKLEKLNGTYYAGLPKLNEEMNWESGVLHGQLNQCVAQTGRLSASKPNQQNFASEMQDVFVTRF